MKVNTKVEHVNSAQATLGEGPLWSAEHNCLFWLDIRASAIHRFYPDSGRNETTKMSQGIYMLVETADGGTIGAVDDGLAFVNSVTGELDIIGNPLPSKKLRFNDGWCITRIAPDGKAIDRVEMPVPRPTSCHFGGSDLSTLFVTSAIADLDAGARKKAPQSGDLFAISPGVTGLPEQKFTGSR